MSKTAVTSEILDILRKLHNVPQQKLTKCKFLIGFGGNTYDASTIEFNDHLNELVLDGFVPYGNPLLIDGVNRKYPFFGQMMVQYEPLLDQAKICEEPQKCQRPPSPFGWTKVPS